MSSQACDKRSQRERWRQQEAPAGLTEHHMEGLEEQPRKLLCGEVSYPQEAPLIGQGSVIVPKDRPAHRGLAASQWVNLEGIEEAHILVPGIEPELNLYSWCTYRAHMYSFP